ncbi:MAG TPA: YMGG-like glycine zipper-containing protein [Opitutaceae bacterium]|nr:YMGG-like glycine zipper-containing protein [Opitutaceae bacterium]
MKTFLTLGFALIALVPAQAQIFRPQAVNGALIGGLAGAIIGNNSGSHNAWRGAAIGAGAGLLIGSAIDDARYDRGWQGGYRRGPDLYVYRHAPVVRYGYSHSHYPQRAPSYYYSRPDYRSSGVFWGGLSGAIIGNNSGAFRHNAWRGAAWGAGLGYIFGSIAEQNARARAVIQESPAVVIPSPAPVVQPRQVTIINNYYNAPTTPMSSANGLFGR